MTRTEWLQARRRGIGGSDAAAVMGFSPWRTPVEVWKEKISTESPVEITSIALKIGSEMEDCVAKIYEDVAQRKVQRYNTMLTDGDCLLGNVDRLVIPDGKSRASVKREIKTDRLLECKTSLDFGWDEVPLQYQAQVQHYMGLCPALQVADVAVIFKPCNGFAIFTVERDDSAICDMQDFLREWWKKHVIEGIPPEPTCEKDCRLIWERSRGISKVVNIPTLDDVQNLRTVREQMKELETREGEIKTRISMFMEDAETLLDDTGKCILTYKTGKDREVLDKDRYIEFLEQQIGKSQRGDFTTTKIGNRPFAFPRKKD